uniref:Uncharacterized protein n=1 Tax=Cacopsylla melanoneura TaxID=428564 RepID=A0A8D9E9S4_9HEMI
MLQFHHNHNISIFIIDILLRCVLLSTFLPFLSYPLSHFALVMGINIKIKDYKNRLSFIDNRLLFKIIDCTHQYFSSAFYSLKCVHPANVMSAKSTMFIMFLTFSILFLFLIKFSTYTIIYIPSFISRSQIGIDVYKLLSFFFFSLSKEK